ncbi:NAD(P)/FAD-dependent oxidoreductase [Streptomyces hydrogenans]|uniref:NAD(P)/FAD-dependent oxidoreductase n=1 Tax=Streptomyces hydrogenans TaxID=1873719 RepID=UPI0035E0FA20
MKRHSDSGHPYWRETAALPSFPPLAESAEADVAVIGAGIDTAWELTRAGLDVVVLDADRLAAGAVRVEDQARFHPLAYLWGRVDDIVAGGGRTHEGTRVVELDRGDPCRLTTDTGAVVSARHVVVATHHPVFDHALLATRPTRHRDLVIAGPLPAAQDPDGMYITEREGKRSVRTAPLQDGGRLLIVTGEAFRPGTGEDTEAVHSRLREWTEQNFPGVTITHRWAARPRTTPPRTPRRS